VQGKAFMAMSSSPEAIMDQPARNFIPQVFYPSDASLEQRFAIELKATADYFPHKLALILSLQEAWSVFAALQLACRHPKFQNDPARWLAEQAARNLQGIITPYPAMKEVAKRGWDPRFDEEAE
jgi:hypothetical protein